MMKPLTPYGHQVAGRSSIFNFDPSTICKPVNRRERFLYKHFPEPFREFIPQYRGDIDVQVREEKGVLRCYGIVNRSKPQLHGDSQHSSPEVNGTSTYCPTVTTDSEKSCLPLSGFSKSKESPTQNAAVIERENAHQEALLFEKTKNASLQNYTSHDSKTSENSVQGKKETVGCRNPWNLKNEKRFLEKTLHQSDQSDHFILLENVTSAFQNPCVLDLKLGSRLYSDEASPEKRDYQINKSKTTTSGAIGLRLCGMQLYQSDEGDNILYRDKYYGNSLDQEGFKQNLVQFFSRDEKIQTNLLRVLVSKLEGLIDCLKEMRDFRFFTCSLLIVYDAKGKYNMNNAEHSEHLTDLHQYDDKLDGPTLDNSKTCKNCRLPDVKDSEHTITMTGVSGKDANRVGKTSLHNAFNHDTTTMKSSYSSSFSSSSSSFSFSVVPSSNSIPADVDSKSKSSTNNTASDGHSNTTQSPDLVICSDNSGAASSSQPDVVKPVSHDASIKGTSIDTTVSHSDIDTKSDVQLSNECIDKEDNSIVTVKMIDFGHVACPDYTEEDSITYQGPDVDCIQSLINLKSILLKLLTHYRTIDS